MLKVLTAYTMEIDDVEAAVGDVLSQLNLKENGRAHSVGLLTCYSEFIDSGVVKALCDALPFDVVGCTTLGNAVPGALGNMMLGLTVLTGDDIHFATSMSSSMMEDQSQPITEAYTAASGALDGPPTMMIAFLALLQHVAGDTIVELLDRAAGGIPVFGTVAVDHNGDYRDAQTIRNGECSRDALAMLLISGPIDPTFLITSISPDKILKQKAVITRSSGNILQEVNDMPILKYMETLGLSRGGQIEGAKSIPFIIDFNDGTEAIARAIYGVTPDGFAICGGVMPENATLSIGSIDFEDVIATTHASLDEALTLGKKGGILMYSCISRNMALGLNYLAELQETENTLAGHGLPYQFTYSGGEVCPVYDEKLKKWVNRFHNDTFVACVF